MKQTAVEWLCSQIYTIQVELECGNNHLKNKIEQAKEMEKQQIVDSVNEINKKWQSEKAVFMLSGEQYYNETFKNK